MSTFVAGVLLFILAHVLPAIPGLRPAVVARLGDGAFKGLVSLLSIAGLACIGLGWSDAPTTAVWAPPPWTRHLAWTLVPLAFVAMTTTYVPSRLGWFLGHPMSWSVILWGTAHALANREWRSQVLFLSLAAWGVFAWLSASARQGFRPKPRPEVPRDGVAIAAGLALAGVVMMAHGWLFGVPVAP